MRFRLKLAESIGYFSKGTVTVGFIVFSATLGVIRGSINSGDLAGTPGVSIDDAAIALDLVAETLQVRS